MKLTSLIPLLLVAPLAWASSRSLGDVTGTYDSNWDDVRLVQHGHRVTGTYVCCGGGTIDGRIEGRTIHYRWQQPGGDGHGVWRVEDGRLIGTWGVGADDDDGGRWDLTRASQLAR